MSRQKCRFVVILVCSCLIALSAAVASSEIPTELVGTWDYASFQAMKPLGKILFKPGQRTLILNADGTYLLKGALPSVDLQRESAVFGRYEVRGQNLNMKPNDRGHDSRYSFKLEQDGKVLLLTDKTSGSVISANRE
jgi:hypothetical protein